jgi:hypothetical protein
MSYIRLPPLNNVIATEVCVNPTQRKCAGLYLQPDIIPGGYLQAPPLQSLSAGAMFSVVIHGSHVRELDEGR